MTVEDNKSLVQGFIEDVINAENTAAIADYCVPGSLLAGGLEGQITAMRTPFPNFNYTVEEMVAEADKVAVRMTMRGTNSGPMVGLPAFGRLDKPVPPTGKSVMATTTYVFTLSDSKIVSFAFDLDQIGMLQQLGWTITPPGQT
jgi:predicted ester cyclase